MTSYQERAEKIMSIVKKHCEDCDYSHYDPIDDIAAELQRCAEEVQLSNVELNFAVARKARASAIEECAKIADKHANYWAKAKFDVDEGSDRDEYFGKQSASQQIAEDIRHRARIGEK